ncbi:MAG: DsbA family protein [Alphaproteobacteria bacterium]
MKKDFLSIVAILLALVGIALGAMSNFGREGEVANALNKNPAMIVEALQKYEDQARQQQLEAAKASIKDSLPAINNDPASPFVGPENAKVVLALFYDYSCGYCHRLYPVLQDVMASNPDVKFVFKPLSFLGPISNYAAKAVIAANEQGKFIEFNNALFANEGQLSEAKVDEIAVKSGLDLEQLKAAMDSEKTSQALNGISQLASKIQIGGVPTMVLDGGILQTFSADEIQSAINAAK